MDNFILNYLYIEKEEFYKKRGVEKIKNNKDVN